MALSQYELIVFDWEGTLCDTIGCVYTVIKSVAESMHLSAVNFDTAPAYASRGLEYLLAALYPDISLDKQEKLFESVAKQLTSMRDGCLFPGVKSMLEQLKARGKKLAIATNRGKGSLQRALSITGLETLFDYVATASDYPLKPDPAMLNAILENLSIEAEKTLMVGDSLADMEMAKLISVNAVGVLFNDNHQPLLDAGAKYLFNTVEELSQAFGIE